MKRIVLLSVLAFLFYSSGARAEVKSGEADILYFKPGQILVRDEVFSQFENLVNSLKEIHPGKNFKFEIISYDDEEDREVSPRVRELRARYVINYLTQRFSASEIKLSKTDTVANTKKVIVFWEVIEKPAFLNWIFYSAIVTTLILLIILFFCLVKYLIKKRIKVENELNGDPAFMKPENCACPNEAQEEQAEVNPKPKQEKTAPEPEKIVLSEDRFKGFDWVDIGNDIQVRIKYDEERKIYVSLIPNQSKCGIDVIFNKKKTDLLNSIRRWIIQHQDELQSLKNVAVRAKK